MDSYAESRLYPWPDLERAYSPDASPSKLALNGRTRQERGIEPLPRNAVSCNVPANVIGGVFPTMLVRDGKDPIDTKGDSREVS
jgi:hypothetical protein